jgi:hypothetical protein
MALGKSFYRRGVVAGFAALAVAVLLCWLFPVEAGAQSLVAQVDRTTVYKGDQVEYTLVFEGAARVKNPQFPSFDGFRVISGPSESSSFQIINGKMSSSITYSWVLIAKKAGRLVIEAVTAKMGKQMVRSNPVTVKVLDPGAALPQGAEPPDVMVKVEVSKKEVYANEPVGLTYKMYFRKNLTNYEVSKLPNTVGFWSEDVPIKDNNRLADETIQGYRYGVVLIRQAVLFPTNPGELVVDPLEVTCNVQERSKTTRRRSRNIFDSFFQDPFYDPFQVVTKTVSTKQVTLRVKPLPAEGRPANFAGDVGQYSFSVKVEPQEVTVNDAVTMKVAVSGTGNIRLITEPSFDVPLDIERYDPKISHSIGKKGGNIRGTKTFEYLLIPRVPGQQKIPAVEFSYFDPVREQYSTLRSGPFEIAVRKGTGFAAGGPRTLSREDVQWRGQDIRYIKLAVEDFREPGDRFHTSAGFYGLMLVPVALFGFGLLYRHQKDQLEQNVSRARRWRAYGKAMTRWKEAAKSARQSDEVFYGSMTKVLAGYLADVMNLPEARGGSGDALEALGEREVDEDLMVEIGEIFERSDFARFAGGQDTRQDRERLLGRTKAVIKRLEKELKV